MRAARASGDNGELVRDHDLFAQAERFLFRRSRVRPDTRDTLAKDVWDEVRAEIVLALAEGFTASAGYMRWVRRERPWRQHNWTGRGDAGAWLDAA